MTGKAMKYILNLENSDGVSSAVKEWLSNEDPSYRWKTVSSFKNLEQTLNKDQPDLVLVQASLDNPKLYEMMEAILEVPFIVLTGQGDEKIAARVMKAGAMDYIVKDEEGAYLPDLSTAIAEAIEKKRKENLRRSSKTELEKIVSQGTQALLESNQRLTQETQYRMDLMDELRETEIRYSMIFNSTSDAIFIHDLEGQILDINDKACENLGYVRGELLNMKISDLHADEGDLFSPGRLEKLNREGVFSLEASQVRKDGSSFPVKVESRLMDYKGRKAAFSIVQDLSQDQEMARERERITKEQRVIDDLSRELRSLINLDEIYECVLSRLRALFEMDYFLLHQAVSEAEFHEIKYAWGKHQHLVKEMLSELSGRIYNPASPAGKALQSFEPRLIHHLPGYLKKHDAHYAFGKHGEIYIGEEVAGVEDATQSALLVPLQVNEQEIGLVELHSFREDAFGEEEVDLMARIANLIAMGLQKSYLLEESKKHIKRLKTQRRIDHIITENQSLPLIMDTLRDEFMGLLEVDALDILYLHPELDSLKIITQAGFRTNPMQYTDLHLGEGPAGHVASSESRMIINDLSVAGTEFTRTPDFDQEGFVSYIGIPLLAKDELVGVLEVFHRSKLDTTPDWIGFLEGLAGQAAIAIAQRNLVKSLRRSREQLNEAYDGIIESWAQAMEMREIETKGHAERLVELTVELAQALGVDEGQMADIRRGAYLHDVGKMGIPDRVLKKKEKLTAEERELIGQHPLHAYEILRSIDYLRPALDIPLYHHERWDGLGYPEGLKGEEIPLAARIFAVVDVWDALRSGRPYRAAWSDQKALEHIKKESGTHFDPQVVEAFLQIVEVED